MDNNSIKKLETDLWEAADLLRQGSKLTSQQYCMPVLGLLWTNYPRGQPQRIEEESYYGLQEIWKHSGGQDRPL